MAVKVDIWEYNEAVDQYLGWCTVCDDFTMEAVEPDATGYFCEMCEENSVMGAENALLEGLLTLVGEED